jgi:superfamily I DNA/RNA helicase
MSHWEPIRDRARLKRSALLARVSGFPSAATLLAAAEEESGIRRMPRPPGDSLLYGSQAHLDVEGRYIWFDQSLEPALASFVQAHEYAHYWLEGEGIACGADEVDAETEEDELPRGVQQVEDYGPDERREREANVYARELLLPLDFARELYLQKGHTARDIARLTGLSEMLVTHQLARALLIPSPLARAQEKAAGADLELDESQKLAATAPRGPLLVQAGPGTGKTRTLVGRIAHLLDREVPPHSILALTFSNRAAEEMRLRLATVRPEVASQVWMGTFHGYGLELLRKYGTRLGLPVKPEVIEPSDAVALLEANLNTLELDYYQNLQFPAEPLRHIVRAISRAKDELVDPARYAALAAEAMHAARSDEDREAARKAAEVARVYARYEDLLAKEGVVDFGDLIERPVVLLREHTDVRRQVRQDHPHVLVDEYQDVNRACGVFLREIAGAGAGLWVVGDPRQSIYRFRGASPDNLRLFAEDFPGAKTTALTRNYRSRPEVLRVIAAFARQMPVDAGGDSFSEWEAAREPGGRVTVHLAGDRAGEGSGLASAIRANSSSYAFRQQVILCRSHTELARYAELLGNEHIPTLYLGDLFERAEVRDLLALVALTVDPDGRGLLRVGAFPEYAIPLADSLLLIRTARERSQYFPGALSLANTIPELSDQGRRGLALLEAHLTEIGVHFGMRPWTLLTSYLLGPPRYLRPLLADDSVPGQQRRLALYQLLRFANAFRGRAGAALAASSDPKRRFLGHIRWLETIGEEKQLRQMPDGAEGVNAVRLLTVHASKGLEFDVVYLPGLAKGVFPSKARGDQCPPPPGMAAASEDWRDAEEDCLFFVALSRATERLALSRSLLSSGGNKSNPSRFYDVLAEVLPTPSSVTWPAAASQREALAVPTIVPGLSRRVNAEEIVAYDRCPRDYYYRYVLELRGRHDDSAYVEFHRCVQQVLRWHGQQVRDGVTVDGAALTRRLDEVWAAAGPVGHPHEPLYRRLAGELVDRACSRPRDGRRVPSPEWEIEFSNGVVVLIPEDVEVLPDGAHLVERLRTGRPTKSETDKLVYALYVNGSASLGRPDATSIRVRFLSTGTVAPVEFGRQALKNRLATCDKVLAGISLGVFPPKPSDRNCPRCAYYFICPAPQPEQ